MHALRTALRCAALHHFAFAFIFAFALRYKAMRCCAMRCNAMQCNAYVHAGMHERTRAMLHALVRACLLCVHARVSA
eukprot:10772274-Alexandrium_andersonii.AAC.1